MLFILFVLALWVDTEGSFMVERVSEMAEAVALHLKRIAAVRVAYCYIIFHSDISQSWLTNRISASARRVGEG